ncbi:MAG: hypothetical protein ACKVS6_09550 [Planctomycetota bacterium]
MLRIQYYLLSFLSGGIWAVIAYILVKSHLLDATWGGVMASPMIGLIIGILFRRIMQCSFGWRAFLTLVSLYLSATLFAVACGVHDAYFRGIANRDAIEVIGSSVFGVLYGLTLFGYFLFLWPLAYANHALLARALPENATYDSV